MNRPILPPPGFMQPIPEPDVIYGPKAKFDDTNFGTISAPRTHWEERFDLALIDECVRKVRSGPMAECPSCGIVYSIMGDYDFAKGGRCDLCDLFYPIDFANAFDLNLKDVTPMTTGLAYTFKCGCYQRRIYVEHEVIAAVEYCELHRDAMGGKYGDR